MTEHTKTDGLPAIEPASIPQVLERDRLQQLPGFVPATGIRAGAARPIRRGERGRRGAFPPGRSRGPVHPGPG